MRGAYCFKLNFTPTTVIANSIAHLDTPFGSVGRSAMRISRVNRLEPREIKVPPDE
jgi:hypothetical protein